MSGSVNQVILLGNVGADPEVRTFQNGGKVANLSLATSEKWKNRNTGELEERTQWHRVSILADGLVGVVESYVRKGTKLHIIGQLETRKWQDQSGQDRYATEVVLRPYSGKLTLLGSGRGQSGDASRSSSTSQSSNGYRGGTSGMDDEIPFAPQVL